MQQQAQQLELEQGPACSIAAGEGQQGTWWWGGGGGGDQGLLPLIAFRLQEMGPDFMMDE